MISEVLTCLDLSDDVMQHFDEGGNEEGLNEEGWGGALVLVSPVLASPVTWVTCWTAPPKQCIEEGGNEEGLNEEGWEGGWKWGGVKWGGGLRRKVEEEGWGGGGVKCLETPNFTLLVALHHFIHKSKIGHDTICRVTILLSSAKRDIFDNYSINSCWINKMNVCIQ